MTSAPSGQLGFSLMFFAASEDALLDNRYDLIVQSARFADTRGFSSVWVPERHFTDFGCLYPNPAVLHAALARETRNLGLRAGSVVIPLHHPLRIAEEWAMVDNLSNGRVGISAATGWNPNDFAFFPERYPNRREEMLRGLETVRALWRGESLRVKNGVGKETDVRIQPKPVQRELPVWFTAAGSPETFIRAGAMGVNVLTHLLDHDVDEIAGRIALYREARARHGWDPEAGEVTLMLHTFIGEDAESARAEVRGPYTEWLKANASLLKGLAANRGESVDLDALSREDKDAFANFLFERFYSSRALMGTAETCIPLLERLHGVGVTEIACLLDFGPRADVILDHLPHLHRLTELYRERGRPNASSVPELRAQARARLVEADQPKPSATPKSESVDAIRARCGEELSSTDFYERLARSGAQFGPQFRGVETIWRRDGEALAHVRLVDAAGAAGADSGLYPPFLDACLQVFAAALPKPSKPGEPDALYLPVGLGTFSVSKQPPERVWSHAVIRSAPSSGAELLEGDLRVFDLDGNLVCEVRGFRLQRTALELPGEESSATSSFYEVVWRAQDLQPAPAHDPGTWIVLTDTAGVGDALARLLREAGERCVLVRKGASRERLAPDLAQFAPGHTDGVRWLLETLAAEGARPLNGVIHLWSLDEEELDTADSTALTRAQSTGVETVLALVQGMSSAPAFAKTARIWLATRSAQSVDGTGLDSPAQSLLWGFAKTIAVEQSAAWGGIVDLDGAPPDEAARQVFAVLGSAGDERFVGFRKSKSLVPRLVRNPEPVQTAPAFAWSQGTYLVTGGLGGLGLVTARWLADQGARHLLLVGRRELSSGSEQAASLRALEALGVRVRYAALDVAEAGALATAIGALASEGWPALRGVVHAAGIGAAEKLVDMTPATMAEILRAKVSGAWQLHHAVAGQPLDFFVAFSSATHQLGILGQGVAAYSAANAFLDALAHYRTRRGLPGLSLCWGPWSSVGMAARSENDQRLRGFGITGVDPRSGVEALGHFLSRSRPEAWVIPIDWAKLLQADGDLRSTPFVSEIAQSLDPRESEEIVARRNAWLEELGRAPRKQRQALMFAHIQQHVVEVMRLDSPDVVDWRRGLFDIGMDSLMALELKNRLQASLGVSIPSTIAFTYPDVQSMAGYLVGQLFPEIVTSVGADAAEREVDASVALAAAQIAHLSESELESLLAQKVESL